MNILRKAARISQSLKSSMKKAREKEAQRQLMLMRQKSYSNLFSSEEERNEYLMSLQTESKQGAALTLREIDILCSSLYPEDQEDCAICDDTRFSQLFLKHFDAGMNNYFLPQYEQQQLDDFVHDWRASIEKDDMSNDRIYIETRKETRYAMKCMKKDPAFQNLSPTLVEKKEKGILLRSKFLYIKIRKIIENIGSNELIVNLAGEEVHIDIFILIHTFFRHYSELTKQYNDNKSYFTPEIIGEQLPIILKEKILIPIEGSGVLGKDLPQSIFIKYFGQLYRIYFNEKFTSNGNYVVKRVNTFYPVDQKKDLMDSRKYLFKKINANLSVGHLNK